MAPHVALAALSAAAAPGPKAPDVSLSTIPVMYYGANWNRSQANVDALARMQMVVLMQEDGHCWATCCPHRLDPRDPARPGTGDQCGWSADAPAATTVAGCDAACDQHGSQEDVFKRIAASAARQGVRGPHAVLYMNAVYMWPFDAAAGLGKAAMVLDAAGEPHMENCDPGIYPSYFFDFGRAAGAGAWLDIVRRHVVNGAADGVYVDCDPTIPFKCDADPANQTCVARRNGHILSTNEAVPRAAVDAYKAGKNATLYEAFKLVEQLGGTFYNKGAPPNKTFAECVGYNPATGKGRTEGDCSGNIWWTGPKGKGGEKLPPPPELHATIRAQRAIDRYVVVGGANSFSSPKAESLPPAADGTGGQNISDGRSFSRCSQDVLAQFLLAVEPGAYLLCNSWDERFARPLGAPRGDATLNGTTWARSFASGVTATWDTAAKVGNVTWPGGWAPPR